MVSFGVKFSFYSFFLSKTVEASMSIIRGAGGLSIGPNLAFYPLVPKDAPALKLLKDLRSRYEPLTETRVGDILQRLGEFFRNGDASPRDIDKDGGSLFLVSRKLEDEYCQ